MELAMDHITASAIHEIRVEKDGSVHLRLDVEANKQVMLSLPATLAVTLRPVFERVAKLAQKTQDPLEGQAQAELPRSVRVLLHIPTNRALLRFDEGQDTELNLSLDRTLLAGLLDQGRQCMAALEKRGLN
jgi:hypothetical protein